MDASNSFVASLIPPLIRWRLQITFRCLPLLAVRLRPPSRAVPANGQITFPSLDQADLEDSRRSTHLRPPIKQVLPTLDAWNLTVQRQVTNSISAEAAYVGNKGSHGFSGDGPNYDVNPVSMFLYNTECMTTLQGASSPTYPMCYPPKPSAGGRYARQILRLTPAVGLEILSATTTATMRAPTTTHLRLESR